MALVTKIRRLRIRDFDYSRIIAISPHPDDSVLGCGGLLHKMTVNPNVQRISVFVMTPGYHGVDSRFFEQSKESAQMDLERWLEISISDLQNTKDLIDAVRARLDNVFDVFGRPGDSDELKLENILKTAIRFGESYRDAEVLGLKPASCLHFLAFPQLYSRRITPEELTRLRDEFNAVADKQGKNLVLVPHPEDRQPAHQIATEVALRALDPQIRWHIWYYQSPWYGISPEAIDVVVSLNDAELHLKRAAAETHRSQTARTPYGEIVSVVGSLNADVLPELVLGFGTKQPYALGKYCELFQIRLRGFYADEAQDTGLLLYSDDHLAIDDDPDSG